MAAFLIRARRRHAVVVHVRDHPDGVMLLRITPDTGPIPPHNHLVGRPFPDMCALRRAVLAAMRGPVGDTLDRVLLSREAYEEWMRIVRDADLSDVAPGEIPDERAREIGGGKLLIWVDVPAGRISLEIGPMHWGWAAPDRRTQ